VVAVLCMGYRNGDFHGGRGGGRNGGHEGNKITCLRGKTGHSTPSVVLNVLMPATMGKRSM
jgi:hypothetical protein